MSNGIKELIGNDCVLTRKINFVDNDFLCDHGVEKEFCTECPAELISSAIEKHIPKIEKNFRNGLNKNGNLEFVITNSVLKPVNYEFKASIKYKDKSDNGKSNS